MVFNRILAINTEIQTLIAIDRMPKSSEFHSPCGAHTYVAIEFQEKKEPRY